MGNAAIQHKDGSRTGAHRRVEQRPRRRRLPGPAPDAELFVRWVQSASSCRASASIPGTTTARSTSRGCIPKRRSTCADLIKLRYRLMPYLYDLLWQSHSTYEPVAAAHVRGVPARSPHCLVDGDDMMLGFLDARSRRWSRRPSRTRDVYLPAVRAGLRTGGRGVRKASVGDPACPIRAAMTLLREGSVIR